jgi:Asp-tRNA(Asn)/Glu-tRNA(Gln) amidotransferase A subunit family amidase
MLIGLATGSIRLPAAASGVWGIRMGVNAVSWEGMVPSVP